MKILLTLVFLLALSGCAIQFRHKNTTVSFLCYQEDRILPNGMYASDEIGHVKCNGRRFVQFNTKFGRPDKADPLNFKDALKLKN